MKNTFRYEYFSTGFFHLDEPDGMKLVPYAGVITLNQYMFRENRGFFDGMGGDVIIIRYDINALKDNRGWDYNWGRYVHDGQHDRWFLTTGGRNILL